MLVMSDTVCYQCPFWKSNDPQNLDTGFCGNVNEICKRTDYESKRTDYESKRTNEIMSLRMDAKR